MPSKESLLRTPPLRVSRPVSACSRCKKAKTRCDGALPACTACQKAGKADECSSANDEFAKGKERSYVAALESRHRRLQERLGEVKARRTQGTIASASSHDSALLPEPNKPSKYPNQQQREASDVDDLVGDFGLLSVT